MLSVSLFGASRVTSSNEQIWSDLGPAGRRWAGFLFTFPDRPHRRERLIDLFWPELDTERGRRAMNSAVWRLRKLLLCVISRIPGRPQFEDCWAGDHSLRGRPGWTLTPGRCFTLRRTALSGAEARPKLGDESASPVGNRNDRGRFLRPKMPEMHFGERERLHSLFIQSAMIMVRHLGLCNYYHDAIRLARHALRFDPYREELVRHLLTLLALDEERIDAIRYYDHWIGLIRKELGISPLPATRAIIEEIRDLHNAENAQHLRARLIGRDEKQIFAI